MLFFDDGKLHTVEVLRRHFMVLRKAEDRGHFENSWLKARHSFSFSSYFDPEWMGFGNLRVLNHDQIQPEGGFPTHPHEDMEIITYVIKGAVAHEDSMGHQEQVKAGEVQRMSAGTGVRHSEFNPSSTELLELFQIWVLPQKRGTDPGYEQKKFTREEKLNQLRLIVDPEGKDGALKVFAPFKMHASLLEKGRILAYRPELDGSWLQVASGRVKVGEQELGPGDGLAFTREEGEIRIEALAEAEFVVLDVSRA
jgi:redox-sensitive bicupin YhaK (pirin superfamily)